MSDNVNIEVNEAGSGQNVIVEVHQNSDDVAAVAAAQAQEALEQIQEIVNNNPVVNQNNVGRWVSYEDSIPGNTDITAQEVSDWLNSQSYSIVINRISTPVVFDFTRVVNGVNKRYVFFFLSGEGTWGKANNPDTPISKWFNASRFRALPPIPVTINDILQDPNANITNIDPVVDGDYIAKANERVWDFTTSGEIQPDGNRKAFYITYTYDNGSGPLLYFVKFKGLPGNYGLGLTQLQESDFVPSTNAGIQSPTSPLHDVLGAGNDSTRKIILKVIGALIQYGGDSISYKKGPYSTQLGFEDPIANAILRFPAKPSNDVVAMVSDINGMTITANQAASEIYLKNAAGDNLATLNVGFLNNEGTTFFYNESTQMLELKDDAGNVLSQVPVSAFVSNLIQSVSFNGSTPYVQEFKDAEGNVVSSVTFGISNIQGLQAALDAKQALMNGTGIPYFNGTNFSFSGTGSANNYLRGDGIQQNFAAAVRANVLLTGLVTSAQTPIADTDNVLQAFGKLQGQLNKAVYTYGTINGDLNTLYTLGTGYYLTQQAPANAPEALPGRWVVNQYQASGGVYGFQLAGYATNGSDAKRIWYRHGGDTGFSPWYKLWTSGDISATDITNWTTAYNRGDFRNFGLGTAVPVPFPAADLNDTTVPNGFYYVSGAALNTPIANSGSLIIERISISTPYITQKYQAINTGDNVRMFIRHYKPTTSNWTPWREIWTSENLSAANITNLATLLSTTLAITGKATAAPTALLGDGSIDIPITEIKELTFFDTRNDNSPPSYYYGRKMVGELKLTAVVDNPPVNSTVSSYSHIITLVAYGDATGGRPTQLSIGTQGIAMRTATSDTTWGPWKRAYTTADFTMSAGDVANWNTAYGWGNHSGLYAKALAIVSGGLNDLFVSQQTSFFFTDVNPANAPTLDSTRWFINQYRQSGSGSGYQIAFAANSTSSTMYHRTNLNGVFSAWVKAWSSSDFTAANIANWNTAFNWGNHSGLYLKLLENILANGTGDVVTINSLGNIKKRTAAEIRQDSGISDAKMADWNVAHTHSQSTGNPHNTQMSDIAGLQSYIDNAVEASRPYKVYTVLLKQIGTSAPEVSALMENTLGFTPTWSYVGVGTYRLNQNAGFPNGKVWCILQLGVASGSGYDLKWRRESNGNEVSIYTLQNGSLINEALNDASFELRIYN